MPLKQSLIKSIERTKLNYRLNTMLDKAESTNWYKEFRSTIKKVILKQVNQITLDQFFIDQLISLSFKMNKIEANQNIVSYLGKKWLSLQAVYDSLNGEGSYFDFFISAGQFGGQSSLDKMDLEGIFLVKDQNVINFLMNRANLLIDSVDSTTKEQLANILEVGKENLLTNYEISQLIKDKFREIAPYRADAIAHTELANAVNAIDHETMLKNGVAEVRWVTSIDERVCPICAPLHNSVVKIEGSFVAGSFTGQYPPAHVNCRCFTERVLVDYQVQNNRIVWTG